MCHKRLEAASVDEWAASVLPVRARRALARRRSIAIEQLRAATDVEPDPGLLSVGMPTNKAGQRLFEDLQRRYWV